MVTWMKGALGDPGWFVAPDQLLEFQQLWTINFGDRRRQNTQKVVQEGGPSVTKQHVRNAPLEMIGAVEQMVSVSNHADGTVPPQHEHRVYAQAVHTTY